MTQSKNKFKFERSFFTEFKKRPQLYAENSKLFSKDFLKKKFSRETLLNHIDDEESSTLNWHIKDLNEFCDLYKNINKSNNKYGFGSLKELLDLQKIYEEEKINVFIIKKRTKIGFAARYLSKKYFDAPHVLIDAKKIHNTNHLCLILSHELVHHYQYDESIQDTKPLGLEIEDSVVQYTILSRDKDITPDEFLKELEADTYENSPLFLSKFRNNKTDLFELFAYSSRRLSTIKWICENRKFPKFSVNSSNKEVNFIDFQKIKQSKTKKVNQKLKNKNTKSKLQNQKKSKGKVKKQKNDTEDWGGIGGSIGFILYFLSKLIGF